MKHNLFLIIVFVAISLVTTEYLLAQSYATTSQGTYTVESNVVNNINYTGQGVNVAVIDLGFDVNNTEISSNIVNYTSFRSDNDIASYNGASDTSQKVNEARANGTLWINSAGNYANHQLQNHLSLQTTCLKSSECSHQSYFFKLLI